MATKLIHPPKSAPNLLHPIASGTIQIMRVHKALSATHSTRNKNSTRFCEHPFGLRTIVSTKASEKSSGVEVEDHEKLTIQETKESLYDALQGINRGIFGVPSEKKAEIGRLIELLEAQNPCPEPTMNIQKMAGTWKLVYSTITILGSKRTKLGLRDFISLEDFYQNIDTIERVDIRYENSTITPEQLMNLFEKNYDLLLSIFNPDGWLNITYVDDNLRIGRDDKGNIFVLERS